MPRFLSPAWVDAVNTALAGGPAPPADVSFTVAHVVRDGPDGDLTYTFRLSGGRAVAALGPATPPADADVTLLEDYATAEALARGELTAQQAVAAGRLKLAGDVTLLLREGPTLAVLGNALASVRAATTY